MHDDPDFEHLRRIDALIDFLHADVPDGMSEEARSALILAIAAGCQRGATLAATLNRRYGGELFERPADGRAEG